MAHRGSTADRRNEDSWYLTGCTSSRLGGGLDVDGEVQSTTRRQFPVYVWDGGWGEIKNLVLGKFEMMHDI